MKFAILNDTHCGVRNSSDVFLDNAEKFYKEIFFPYLLENDIKHIVHLGDYYDNRKFINFRALNRNRNHFLKKLREYGITMDIFVGNHDTYYKNTNNLNSLKELFGHYTDVVNIIHESTEMQYGDVTFAMIPWINSENEKQTMEFLKNTKATHVGGHFDIIGFEMLKGVESTHGLDSAVFERFQAVYTGHYHVKSSKNNIHYLGSQMEFTWSDAHNDKYFHIFDTETQELTKIRNPHTLFHRIHYDDTNYNYLEFDFSLVENKFVKIIVINKSDVFTFDRFVDKIQSCKIYELKIQENFNEFIGEKVDDETILLEDTTSLLNSYIDGVDTELDKDRIKIQMHDLMTEAQTLEVA